MGQVVFRRKLQRAQVAKFFAGLSPCLVGIEACATAHHWGRLIGAAGHQVRLIPPSYVKPYVQRSKTDAADAVRRKFFDVHAATGSPIAKEAFASALTAATTAAAMNNRPLVQ
jgi:transposase